MKYTNRADLLIAAGESIKMQEKAGCIAQFMVSGSKYVISTYMISQCENMEIDFPLAVVEGKPVFVGDELYCNMPLIGKFKVRHDTQDYIFDNSSWNPPKPKTLMVELLREDAEFVSSAYKTNEPIPFKGRMGCVAEACRKALESQ